MNGILQETFIGTGLKVPTENGSPLKDEYTSMGYLLVW